jgi:hemerythrin-like domain-containing protein
MITRRREFLLSGAVLGIGGAAAQALLAGDVPQPVEDVSAVEDLMREHGVLQRILLIYEDCLGKLSGPEPFSGPARSGAAIIKEIQKRLNKDQVAVAAAMRRAVMLIQQFIEEYHEKLEEDYVFPEFEKRNMLVPLVKVLREQHAAGRAITTRVLKDLAPETLTLDPSGSIMVGCRAFVRMYRPHAAREDTVLFPALKKILSPKQLDALGDQFEEEENRRFGADGFGKIVEQVAAIERQLNIHDLAQFTPKK